LEQCAVYYDQQSAKISADLTKTSAQKNTLQNQITSLKKKVQNLEYQIGQSTIMVKDLNIQIEDTQVSIDKTSGEINKSQNQMAEILKSIYQEDQKPSFVVLEQDIIAINDSKINGVRIFWLLNYYLGTNIYSSPDVG
jgi:septal ring factor EnvC (AmiA/AmiB activator)